ncbi:MAG: hypothetical protein NTW16_13015 [Bacteroidetes bacterium]|nr:hypothetical protein [Bacteroidota bacterium]
MEMTLARKMKAATFFLVGCCIVFFSCQRTAGVPCTEEYRMLTVSIRDSSSNPVILSDYYVKKTSTGEIVNFTNQDPYLDSINRIQGVYFLLTDGLMSMTAQSGTEFEFHGMKENKEIVNEKYLIGNNECHVNLISGKTELINIAVD